MKADNKTQPTSASVADFLNAIEHPRKREDSFRLLEMMREVTGMEPRMWGSSIVGFGCYHYKYASGREGDMPVTGFSPRKQALTLYIMPGFESYTALLEKLGKHKLGKSCLYITKLADVDMDVLRELVAESVRVMQGDEG
jgi:hypothetical protein